MIRRRDFITLLGGATAAWPLAARAQQDGRVQALLIREQAEATAARISQFIDEIESQLGSTVQLPWSAGTIDQRRFAGLQLLRQVAAISELTQLDSSGIEQLKVSRLAMDVVLNKRASQEPKFTEAMATKVYYGPVYFRREREPYMTLSVAGERPEYGVSVAEINLKLIQDLVASLKVGQHGVAYVVDAQNRVIAHPEISLIKRDVSGLTQVQAAHAAGPGPSTGTVRSAQDIHGRDVFSAYAAVAKLGWLVFVELPAAEVNAP